MRPFISMVAAAAAFVTLAQPAAAGPGFGYSWFSSSRTFDQCIAAANTMMGSLNLPKIQRTKFGVTGETDNDTVFVNCEDNRHIAVALLRASRPEIGEIDTLVALMQQILENHSQAPEPSH